MTEMEQYWEDREFQLKKISVPKRKFFSQEKNNIFFVVTKCSGVLFRLRASFAGRTC